MVFRRVLIFVLMVTGLQIRVSAQKKIEFSPQAILAYNKAMSLRLEESRLLLAQIKKEDPNNHVVYFIENYIDFFTLFIGENKKDFNVLKSNKDKRLEKIAETDPNSPYYLYCNAEINLQWALVRLKFEEYTKAFFEVKTAYNDLQTNVKKFPGFIANKKSLGVLHAAIGTIPDEYQWGVSWIGGMKGSISQGIKELESVINYSAKNPFLFRDEAVVMYAFTMLHLNNSPERAWDIISTHNLKPASNPLTCFVLANLAMRTGRNETAINYLNNRPKGNAFYPFLYLDFMLGSAKLQRLDKDADVYLLKYVKQFKGRNYIKEAWQKLAWHALISGNPAGYTNYMATVLKSGYKQLDEDKNAEKEARAGAVPNAILLQARLLFDGGYLVRSYKILNTITVDYFQSDVQKLEYFYRKGRVSHSLNNYLEAIKYYEITIRDGRKNNSYFACNAALNLGLIYESQKNKPKAKTYFNMCLSMSPDEYKTSLHQKAKAGLSRL